MVPQGMSGRGLSIQMADHPCSLTQKALCHQQLMLIHCPENAQNTWASSECNLAEVCTEPSQAISHACFLPISLVCLPQLVCGSQAANSTLSCSQMVGDERRQKIRKRRKEKALHPGWCFGKSDPGQPQWQYRL